MRRLTLYALLFVILLPIPSCSNHSTGTTSVVKPKNYKRWYVPKKDKRKKRTKVVRMKS